jgi:hypothetical protein
MIVSIFVLLALIVVVYKILEIRYNYLFNKKIQNSGQIINKFTYLDNYFNNE